MTEEDEAYYEEMANRAERGELHPIPGTLRRGAESRREARRLLLDGSEITEDELLALFTTAESEPEA